MTWYYIRYTKITFYIEYIFQLSSTQGTLSFFNPANCVIFAKLQIYSAEGCAVCCYRVKRGYNKKNRVQKQSLNSLLLFYSY